MNLLDMGYFKLARNVSKYSDHRVKVGCVIVKKKPICASSNKAKSHPKCNSKISNSTHAEIRALINCGMENLNGAVMYIFRETKRGYPALARPCNMCYTMLKSRGIRKVFYTIPEYPFWKEEKL